MGNTTSFYSVFGFCRSSSGSLRTAVTPAINNSNMWLDHLEEEVIVHVFSRRISLLVALHHFIVCESDNMWRIAEWGAHNTAPLDMYACERIRGKECYYLGKYKLKEVVAAIKRCSENRVYASDYNCNHWSEEVGRELGWKLTTNWNCPCNHIDGPEPYEEE